jgi:hypothetical protein
MATSSSPCDAAAAPRNVATSIGVSTTIWEPFRLAPSGAVAALRRAQLAGPATAGAICPATAGPSPQRSGSLRSIPVAPSRAPPQTRSCERGYLSAAAPTLASQETCATSIGLRADAPIPSTFSRTWLRFRTFTPPAQGRSCERRYCRHSQHGTVAPLAPLRLHLRWLQLPEDRMGMRDSRQSAVSSGRRSRRWEFPRIQPWTVRRLQTRGRSG